jgi:hypothetical protein
MSACMFESKVIHAAQRDEWTDSLRAHLASCDDCMAAVSVAPWMHRFAQLGDREHRLPDASIVFLKARLLQASAESRRASRPMDFVQMVAYLVVAGGWAGLLTWKWAAVEAWLRSFTPSGLLQGAIRTDSLSLSFFALAAVLASMTVMLALHTILAEE